MSVSAILVCEMYAYIIISIYLCNYACSAQATIYMLAVMHVYVYYVHAYTARMSSMPPVVHTYIKHIDLW